MYTKKIKSLCSRTVVIYALTGLVLWLLLDMRIPRWQRTQYLSWMLNSGLAAEYKSQVLYFDSLAKVGLADAQTYGEMGSCFYELGQYREAADAYKKALTLRPGHGSFRENLARIQEKMKDPQKNIELLHGDAL